MLLELVSPGAEAGGAIIPLAGVIEVRRDEGGAMEVRRGVA